MGPFFQPFNYRSTTISETAREIRCDSNGNLIGATVSDHGYIIVSMFFDASSGSENGKGFVQGSLDKIKNPLPGRMSKATSIALNDVYFHDEREWNLKCRGREENGYNSGMGEIFRKVCSVSR